MSDRMIWVLGAATIDANPRTSGYGENGDVGHNCVPPGETGLGSRTGVRAVQHRRRPADGEDPPHRTEGGAPVRQVARGHRLARLLPRPAQPSPLPRRVRLLPVP